MNNKSIDSDPKIRLVKYISSSCNYCSRRSAAELITSGRVKVNGITAKNPLEQISFNSTVSINNENIKRNKEIELWAYHKPPRSIVSLSNATIKLPTIFELLPRGLKKKIPIGRLDVNSSGLLLLTNNGDFARMASHPSSKILRIYEVSIYGKIGDFFLKPGRKKITIENIQYNVANICIVRSKKLDHTLTITLSEGKNREIRKIMSHFNLKINYLVRISYGNIKLAKMHENSFRKCSKREINSLIEEAKNSDFKKFLNLFEESL